MRHQDIWDEIACHLSPQELVNFKLACTTFLAIGKTDKVLRSIYNQLYARLRNLDPSLPENLEKDYQKKYQRGRNKIGADWAAQTLSSQKKAKAITTLYKEASSDKIKITENKETETENSKKRKLS